MRLLRFLAQSSTLFSKRTMSTSNRHPSLLMLVNSPDRELVKFKGYTVLMRSDDPVEDMSKFDRTVDELRVLLISVIGDLR